MGGGGQDDQGARLSPDAAREAASLEGLLTAAPATANGLTLLGVLGMIGNLDHPDYAIDKASKRVEEAAAELERVHSKFDRALSDTAKLVVHSRLWNQASLLLLAAACIVAWSGHAFFGFRLQP